MSNRLDIPEEPGFQFFNSNPIQDLDTVLTRMSSCAQVRSYCCFFEPFLQFLAILLVLIHQHDNSRVGGKPASKATQTVRELFQ